jgi:acetylornithine deacetylase/succinyl-diaminopimelate desuccinylase-like protein
MYGRGAAVSKSDFATYAFALLALDDLAAAGERLSGAVELHLTYDEEAGGNIGPGFLLREGSQRARPRDQRRLLLRRDHGPQRLPAPGGRGQRPLRPRRDAVHRIDALEAATGVLSALYAWRKTLAERTSGHPGIGSPQMTVGLVKGGINTNVVPDRVTFRLDRRMIPEERPAEVEAELRSVIAEAAAAFPRRKVAVGASSWSSRSHPAGRRADDRAALPARDPGHGRAGRDEGRAALHRRAALRLARDPDRALRRRPAHDRGGQRAPRRRAPAALDLRKATEVVALTLADLLRAG